MAKITRLGGATNYVDSGFVDDTARIRGEAAEREEPPAEPEQPTEPPVSEPLPFDPGDYTVSDVRALLRDLSDEDTARVLEAERSGLNRASLVGN